MKKSLLFAAGIVCTIFSLKASALGWEECKHLAQQLTPQQEAACKAANQSCLVNNFKYAQCRLTAPEQVSYLTIDNQSSKIAATDTDVLWRNLVLQKGVSSSHVFSWPTRLSKIRIEYSYRPAGTTNSSWGLVGVFNSGSTYTVIDYSRYVPSSAVWSIAPVCGGKGYRLVSKAVDASLYFRIRVEDADGSNPQKSNWSYLDATSLYYGTDKRCQFVGFNQPGGIIF